MKTILLVLLTALLPSLALAQTHPHFLATVADNARFASYKKSYDLNPANPPGLGGQIYKYILTAAARVGGSYYDVGLHAALLYRMSGDPAHAQWSYTVLTGAKGVVKPSCSGYGAFYFHLSLSQAVLAYDFIYPALTQQQRHTLLTALDYAANCMVAQTQSIWHTGADSDETSGNYYAVALLYEATHDYNTPIVTLWNTAGNKIGGMMWTSNTNMADSARNATHNYIYNSNGGTYIEGAEYSQTSGQQQTLWGAILERAQGAGNFADVVAWNEQAAHSLMSQSAGDVSSASKVYYFEDVQDWEPRLQYRTEWGFALAGANVGKPIGPLIQDWIMSFVEHSGGIAALNPSIRGFLLFDPTATRGNYKTAALRNYTTGAYYDTLLSRTGWNAKDAILWTHYAKSPYVQHVSNVWGDIVFSKNNKMAIEHPYTYGGPGTNPIGTNGVVQHGGPTTYFNPIEYAQIGAQERSDANGYEYITGTRGGTNNNMTGWGMGGWLTFMQENTRSIVWLMGLDDIVVFDRVNTTDVGVGPLVGSTGCAAGVKRFWEWLLAHPRPAELFVHSPVKPTVSGTSYLDWTYDGTNHTRFNRILPADATFTVEDEKVVWVDSECYYTGINTDRKKWHTIVTPGRDRQWNTFLSVWDVYDTGTPATAVPVRDTRNMVDGTLVTKGSTQYLLAFNAIQGANVSQQTRAGTTLVPSGLVASQLQNVRLRDAGFTLTWNAGALATKALLFDLNPSGVYRYKINGGTAQDLTLSAGGVGVVNVSATGSVTLELLSHGALPGPR